MQTQTLKQEALDALQRLPDNADIEEIMYRLYVINQIRQGMQEVAEGKGINSEELLRDMLRAHRQGRADQCQNSYSSDSQQNPTFSSTSADWQKSC